MSICQILMVWVVFFAALFMREEALAGPVLKIDVVLEQADGSKFIARPYGDEWHNGYETEDGYTILFDEPTGNWIYADRAADGSLVATGMIVNKDMPPAPKQLRAIPFERPENNLFQRNFIEEGLTRPATGNQRVLVLLVQFANRTLMTSEAQWANLIFGTAFSNVRHYYREVSYSHLDLIPAAEGYGTVNDGVVKVTLPYNHLNTGGNLSDTNRQIVREALIAADPYVDFVAFDDDSDGYISSGELHIVVIVAGYETSYGGSAASCSPNVWAHTGSLSGTVPAPTLDGKIVASSAGKGNYTQQGEWHCSTGDNPGHMATIGQFVHELGHTLWLPDEYDTDGSSAGIGNWGVMGGGSWNTCSGGYSGNCPSHPTAWDKWYLSWLAPTQITETQTVTIPDITTNPTVFQLRDNPGGVDWSYGVTSGTGEYFLVENRQRTGYNTGLPGSGLLIWHIWEGASSGSGANQNEAGRRLIALTEADGLNHLELGTNRGDAGDPFPGTSNNTVFDDTTNPSSKLYCSTGTSFCDPSGVSITGISASGAMMTATMVLGFCTYFISPTSQTFSASGGTDSASVTAQSGCSWTALSNASWITITSGSSGSGNGTVNYSVGANTGTTLRSGTMTIAGRTFTVSQNGVETLLLNGVPQSGSITGTSSQSTWIDYYIDLLNGATNLVINLYNLSADVDLYVRRGSKPTLFTYDCRSWNEGTTNEQCIFSAPSSGRWWISVNNYATGIISYTIKATWRQGIGASDFDGDGATDVAAFHLPTDQFFTDYAGNLGQFGWGASDSMPLIWDYDGDGKTDVSIYHIPTNQWFVKGVGNLGQYGWGGEESIPVPGDYNGDGRMERAFYHSPTNRWFVEGQAPVTFGWNGAECIPVPGDYDGDAKTDMVLYHIPSNQWFQYGVGNLGQFGWGGADCIPVPGDYNGDGITDIAVYHVPTNQWFVKGMGNLGQYGWGGLESFPIPGDYDGDGVMERGFYRSSENRWFIEGESDFVWGWGGSDFMPITSQIAVYNWFRFKLHKFE